MLAQPAEKYASEAIPGTMTVVKYSMLTEEVSLSSA